MDAVAVTLEKSGGGRGAADGTGDGAGSGAVAVGVADAVVGAGAGGVSRAGCEVRLAMVITAATKAARATMPAAASSTEVHRRCGLKSGNSVSETAAADHGRSASRASIPAAAALMSWPVPMYNGRVVAVVGVSGEVVVEMVLCLRGIGPGRS